MIAQIDSPFAQTKQSDLPLKLNQYVNAEIQGDRLKEVYVIPRSALRNNSEVIIINEEGTIARRSVKVVWKQGEDIVISEGISDRELLCLTPILFASEGIRVKPLIEGESLPTSKNPLTPQRTQSWQGNSSGSEPKTRILMHQIIMVLEWRCCQRLMLAILMAGDTLFKRIPTEVFPEFELDMITVSVPYRGSTPAEVEESVVVKIEEAIQDLQGIKEINSTASEGAGSVSIEVDKGYDSRDLLDDIKKCRFHQHVPRRN